MMRGRRSSCFLDIGKCFPLPYDMKIAPRACGLCSGNRKFLRNSLWYKTLRLFSGFSAERGNGSVRILDRHAVEIAAKAPADVRDVLFAECGLLFGFRRVQSLGFGFMIKFVDSCNLCFGHIGFLSFLCLPACRQRCSVRLYHFFGILANPVRNGDVFCIHASC